MRDAASPDARSSPLPSSAVFAAGRAIYVGADDHLRLTTFNAAAAVAVALEARVMDVGGEVQAFADRHVPNTDRTTASTLIRLREGWLLDWLVRATAGTPRVGQCFAIVELVRGFTGAVVPIAVLGQGYVTDTSRLGGPGSRLTASIAGPGVLRSITGTDPAAGVEIAETVPTNARWRPLAIQFAFVTDATVANREVSLVVDDGATGFARVPSGTAQTATLTRTYSAFHHAPRNTIAQDGTLNLPLPRIDLQGGHSLRTVTTNLQAGDNFGPPQLLVEEWIED